MKNRKPLATTDRTTWSLLGVPDHLGVYHVRGRLGAAYGPSAFRKAWSSIPGDLAPVSAMVDAGDVEGLTLDVASNHELTAGRIMASHLRHGLSVMIGGGHDHGYSHLQGISRALTQSRKQPIRLGCINIDAHLDLRAPAPEITSGSPFYLAIESKILDPRRLVEFGVQPQCNAPELWAYASQKRIDCVRFETLRGGKAVGSFRKSLNSLARGCDAIVISFDLDSVAHAFAPGVSSPQPEGFTPSEIFAMMELAGSHPKTASLGVFELNPEHDRDAMTAKLAAVSVYHFITAALAR